MQLQRVIGFLALLGTVIWTSTLGCAAQARKDAPDCAYYEEHFDQAPKDWMCGGVEVRWCKPLEKWDHLKGCDTPGSMEITPGAVDTTRFWYHFGDAKLGDRKPTKVRIEFNYAQSQGASPTPNLAKSYLEYTESKESDFKCPRRGDFIKQAKLLNNTWKGQLSCTNESFELAIKPGVRAIYWQFRKQGYDHGPRPFALMVDDLKVTLLFNP